MFTAVVKGQGTISEAMQQFKLHKRTEGHMERTLQDYDRVFAHFLKAASSVSLADLTLGAVRRYVHSMIEQGWKPATINVHLRVLRCWLRWLYEEAMLSDNLATSLKLVKVPKPFPCVLTVEQAKALIAAAKVQRKTWTGLRNYTMVVTFLETMLRLSELINLEMADVNLQSRSIRIRHGKGDKERMVFMGKTLVRLMAAWLAARGEHLGEDRVFITRQGGSLDQRHVQRILSRLAGKAGLAGVRVSPHVLRHTGATLLARAIDPFTLQQLLGHASITTTQIYVHLAGTALQQAHIRNSSVDRLTQGKA